MNPLEKQAQPASTEEEDSKLIKIKLLEQVHLYNDSCKKEL